ncbi:MAG: FHA domain-containing protein [Lachnospiraceae bacterium]|nr:FHA domain-containing protein [Lachnospiraceae bacterium]
MKTEYKRSLQNNYLVLEVPEPDEEDGYGLRMAEQNPVKGLLPMHESRRDGKLFLHYEITSKQTLESLYEKKVMGYQDILYILSGIRDTLEDMRKYLLSPKKLLFAPELIYVLPERGGLLLCYYVKEDECPVTMLAEFILKRLDHRDRQAVTLGYGFFQQASGANFSLATALKEILSVSGEAGREAAVRTGRDGGMPRRPQAEAVGGSREAFEGSGRVRTGRFGEGNESFERAGGVRLGEGNGNREGLKEAQSGFAGEGGTISSGHRTTKSRRNENGYNNRKEYDYTRSGMTDGYEENTGFRNGEERLREESCEDAYEETYAETYAEDPPVIHRERKRKREKKESFADRLFSIVHPAILLSFLAFLVVLELLAVFGVLGLTEAGGCFFLMLSAEILINRKLLNKKKTEKEEWEEEEADEEYQRILREMYQREAEAEPEPVEETRCLLQEEETDEICLIFVPGKDQEQDSRPDICPGAEPIYIGKIKGEADIILDSSTVSRMHARLEQRDGKCSLRDMNSKNGTFVNGRRLMPQEECEIRENDTVAFAEITYRVAKRRVYR